jgi:hypothetical protein
MKSLGEMTEMLKQAKDLQGKMQKLQAEMAAKTLEASSGGGMVKVKVNGRQEILSVNIDPEMAKQDDLEMLQDLIVAAVNEALRQSQEMMQSEIGKLTGGMNFPGLF